jgi:type VII secretion protein EccB
VRLATHVLVGSIPDGGAPPSDANGLLVASRSTDERFLLWRGHRLRVPGNTVLAALGWAAVIPLPVAHPFLNAIPPGPDLMAPVVAGDGQPAPHLVDGAPTAIGQLFHAAGQHYVMTADGVAPVGALTARLWQAAGRATTQTSAGEAGRLLTQTRIEPAGLPEFVPTASGQDGAAMACAAYTGSDGDIRVEIYGRVPESFPSTNGDIGNGLTADRVAVPGGRGALVATLLPDDVTATGVVYLVTDQGIRYPLATQDTDAVRAALGYGAVAPVAVPAALLDLLPAGPALDPRLANAFAQ